MAEIQLPAPASSGAAYTPDEPTRNTEELSRYLLEVFQTLAEAGFTLRDDALLNPFPVEVLFKEGIEPLDVALKQEDGESFSIGVTQTEGDMFDVAVTQKEGDTFDVALTPTEEEEDATVPDALWSAQSDVIRQQSEFLSDISDIYEMRMVKVPKNKPFWEELLQEFLDECVELFVGQIVGAILGKMAGEATEFAFALIMTAYDHLKDSYDKASQLCQQLIKENAELLNLECNAENYALRTAVLKQHDVSVQNILRVIETLEEAVKTGNGSGGASAELIDAIRDLQYNDLVCDVDGIRIWAKSKIIEYDGDE